jgi:hypothetical protein
MEVIIQAAATSFIHMQMLATSQVLHSMRNTGYSVFSAASSSALVASSAKIHLGFFSSTRAIARRCCSPPESFWLQAFSSSSRTARSGSKASSSACMRASSL